MAAADGIVEMGVDWAREGLMSWEFLRDLMPRVVAEALCFLVGAGDESLEDQGEAAAEGDRETVSDCGPLDVPAEVLLGGRADERGACASDLGSTLVLVWLFIEAEGGSAEAASGGRERELACSLDAIMMMVGAGAEHWSARRWS
jgi:hypothetical protein